MFYLEIFDARQKMWQENIFFPLTIIFYKELILMLKQVSMKRIIFRLVD
jgi:hypothetical protein